MDLLKGKDTEYFVILSSLYYCSHEKKHLVSRSIDDDQFLLCAGGRRGLFPRRPTRLHLGHRRAAFA